MTCTDCRTPLPRAGLCPACKEYGKFLVRLHRRYGGESNRAAVAERARRVEAYRALVAGGKRLFE